MKKTDKLLGIAMGGHATLSPGSKNKSIPVQEHFMRKAAEEVLKVTATAAIDKGFDTRLFTHGSGPQTGIIMDRARISEERGMHELFLRYASMDLIGSLGMTFQLMILEQRRKISYCLGRDTEGAAVVPTSFIVDPKTMEPKKPIGRPLDDDEAEKKRGAGHTVEDRDGKGLRVLVPSPKLLKTLDSDLMAIEADIKRNLLVIAGGTGGSALAEEKGELVRKDAVIDKDNAFARIMLDLAEKHGLIFDTAVILTDSPFMVRHFSLVKDEIREELEKAKKEPDKYGSYKRLRDILQKADPINRISVAGMREVLEKGIKSGDVAGGAIAKIGAACDVIEHAGVRKSIICCLDNFGKSFFSGLEGTVIEKGAREV